MNYQLHRSSVCPQCKQRLMARHSGPLHLSIEDVYDDSDTTSRTESRSKSIHEASSVNTETVQRRRAGSAPPEKPLPKPKGTYDRDVRIARPSCSNDNVVTPVQTKSLAELAQKSSSVSGKKRQAGREVSPKPSNVPNVYRVADRRKSKRVKQPPSGFNMASILCSVCNRSFQENVPFGFYNEPIACSYKCARFNGCIAKPVVE